MRSTSRPSMPATTLLVALLCTPAALASSTGKTGYSGNPATSGGQTCTKCHTGGTVPTVTLSGPTTVEVGRTYTYQLLIQGGQQVAGGLGVSATDGTLVATEGGTMINSGELVHSAPRNADKNGDVLFTFDWTAPAGAGTATMYAAGNSVNGNGAKSGDACAADTLAITVDPPSCQVGFTPYGSGTPGTGGFVPDLDGTPGPCAGGATVDLTDARGGAFALLWVSPMGQAQIPFAGGYVWLDLSFFLSFPVRLGGTPGQGGAGTLTLPVGDVTTLSGYSIWMQVLAVDPVGTKGVALSNGLRMDVP